MTGMASHLFSWAVGMPTRAADVRQVTAAAATPTCALPGVAVQAGMHLDQIAALEHAMGGPAPQRGIAPDARDIGQRADELTASPSAQLRLLSDPRALWLIDPDEQVVKFVSIRDLVRDGGVAEPTKAASEAARVAFNRLGVAATLQEVSDAVASDAALTIITHAKWDVTEMLGTAEPAFYESDVLYLVHDEDLKRRFSRMLAVTDGAAPRPTPGLSDVPQHDPTPEIPQRLTIEQGRTLGLFADGKSFRLLDPDATSGKLAETGVQLACYTLAAAAVLANRGVDVLDAGLALTLPKTGGTSYLVASPLDLRSAMAELQRVLASPVSQAAGLWLANSGPLLPGSVSANTKGEVAGLNEQETGHLRTALAHVHGVTDYQPGCLTSCPLGRTCRGRAEVRGAHGRYGLAGTVVGATADMTRAQELASGAGDPPGSDVEHAAVAHLSGAVSVVAAATGTPHVQIVAEMQTAVPADLPSAESPAASSKELP